MRQAEVRYKDWLAGILTETNDGEYVFKYNETYIKQHSKNFITFSMPVTERPYTNKQLFPFFEGLIPEGWLLEIASKNWKINKNDRMGLLLASCQNCIGAVSIIPIKQKDEE